MDKNETIEIHILGQRLVLKASENDPDTLQQVLQLASQKIAEIEKRSAVVVPHYVAILALLEMTEEYLKSKKKTLEYKQKMDEKIKRLGKLKKSILGPTGGLLGDHSDSDRDSSKHPSKKKELDG